MKRFAKLVETLSGTTKTNDKRDALVAYFEAVEDADRLWLIALFTGRRPKRIVASTLLKVWCMKEAGIAPWLFDEAYHIVGDLGEAIALMLPPAAEIVQQEETLSQLLTHIKSLQTATEDEKKDYILTAWRSLSRTECFVFNKLISGGFRIGVSEALVIQAAALFLDKDKALVAHALAGGWKPDETTFEALFSDAAGEADQSRPYPFYLAYPLEGTGEALGLPADWQVEWKWDGIRGQLIRRQGETYLWSRGEDLITDRFPEIKSVGENLPDGTVLDGEILAYRDGLPMSFQYLQTRTGRKTVSRKDLQNAPAVFMVYDLLELAGDDLRPLPLRERRQRLETLFAGIENPAFILSDTLDFADWNELPGHLEGARERGVEGFMIKSAQSAYGTGRKRGDWWKWKIEPLTIDAVMIYAQKGHGRRSNLYTDYTFAVKDGDKFVPFAKAYSGLTDKEIGQVDKWVKRNSLEQFGPVRTVKPELVFEIGFEGISASGRHKSGVAVRFPRILKWRTDKKPEEVDTIETLKGLLDMYGKMG